MAGSLLCGSGRRAVPAARLKRHPTTPGDRPLLHPRPDRRRSIRSRQMNPVRWGRGQIRAQTATYNYHRDHAAGCCGSNSHAATASRSSVSEAPRSGRPTAPPGRRAGRAAQVRAVQRSRAGSLLAPTGSSAWSGHRLPVMTASVLLTDPRRWRAQLHVPRIQADGTAHGGDVRVAADGAQLELERVAQHHRRGAGGARARTERRSGTRYGLWRCPRPRLGERRAGSVGSSWARTDASRP